MDFCKYEIAFYLKHDTYVIKRRLNSDLQNWILLHSRLWLTLTGGFSYTQNKKGVVRWSEYSTLFRASEGSARLFAAQLYKQAGHEVRTIIFRYVFGYYNTIRVTSFNPEGLPPVAYREMYLSMGIAAWWLLLWFWVRFDCTFIDKSSVQTQAKHKCRHAISQRSWYGISGADLAV